jgi:polysaccharide biosynthesis transport protein
MSYQGSSRPQGGVRRGPSASRPTGAPDVPGAGTLSFRDIIGMLRRHLLLLLVLLTLISGAGIALTLYLYHVRPTYMAEAMIEVDEGRGNQTGIRETADRIPVQLLTQFINNQVQIIKDKRLLADALDPRIADEMIRQLRFEARARTAPDAVIEIRAKRISDNAVRFFGSNELNVQANTLSGRISVTNPLRTQLIRVRLHGRDRQMITDLVNSVVDSYMLNYQKSREAREKRRMAGLQVQEASVSARLANKRTEIRQLTRQNPSVTLSTGRTDIQQRLQHVQTARIQANLALIADSLARQQGDVPPEEQVITPELELIVQNDPVLNNHKAMLSNLRREKEQRTTRFSRQHDEMKALDSRIATTDKLIEDRRKTLTATLIARQRESAETNFEASKSRYEQIDAMYRTTVAEQKQQEEASLEYEQRVSELAELIEEHREIRRAVHTTQFAITVSANNVSVRQVASVPTDGDKAGPRLALYIPVSVLLGLIISFAMVLTVELIDNRVRTPLQLIRSTQMPVLGSLPDRRDDRQTPETVSLPLLARDAPRGLIAESFRQLRTALMYSTDTDLKTLLVTSARADAGKTVIASNLAITLAQGGSRVLVIDTNFRRPMIHRAYDLPNSVGLSSVLARLNSFDEAVQTTSVANLDVLPCGPIPPSPADLLGSEAMQRLLADVRAKYDSVILDGAPILIVSDAHVLCSMVDGTALVVNATGTSRGVASRAKRTLVGLRARVVGAILNRVRATKGGYFREAYKSYYDYAATTSAPAEDTEA